MKTSTMAVLAGVGSLGIWFATAQGEPGVDPIISHSVPARATAHAYTISNIVTKTACLAERGQKLSGRSEIFVAGVDCDAVWPGLSAARTWINNGDGTMDVANAQGEAIITVTDGDGLAYEAVEPADALVTFIPAD